MLSALNVFKAKLIDPLGCIIQEYLKVRELRISSLANAFNGNASSRSKAIQRTLKGISEDLLSESLLSPVNVQQNIYLVDYTEIEREWAKNTKWVGTLSDGETRGAAILTISIPYKGRAIPIIVKEYSSAILDLDSTSKNIILKNALLSALSLLEGKIIVADREFCSEENLKFLIGEGIKFVVRFKVGGKNRKTIVTDKNKNKIDYTLQKGEMKIFRNVYYKGKVKIHLIGIWDSKYHSPLYIITNHDPKQALDIYKIRMKIEQSYRDLKDKLGFNKIMTKSRENFIKLILIAILAYIIAMLIGELLISHTLSAKEARKYSGLFVLLKQTYRYSSLELKKAVNLAVKYLQGLNSNRFYSRNLNWRTCL